jgi:hypothetical protein
MTDTPTYPMRWRGRETAPLSIADIEERLDAHEIGLWHEIQHEGRWVTLKDFIDATGKISRALKRKTMPTPLPEATQDPEATAAAKGLSRRWRMAYATLGLLYPTISLVVALLAASEAGVALVYAGIGLGLHNLYANRWSIGALQIAVALTFVSLGWTTLWLGFWPAIEVIFVWRDGRGFAMK